MTKKISKKPDVNNIGKIFSNEKLKSELKNRIDRLNGEINNQAHLKENKK